MLVYVVTGGLGFIGQALATQLKNAGHKVIIASPVKSCNDDRFEWIKFDLNDHSTINNIIRSRPDYIYHLAWSTTPASAEINPSADINTNLTGTICLLNTLAKTYPVPILLMSSGGTVYGLSKTETIKETHELNPISIYGITKCAMERYALQSNLFESLDIRIARVSNPFGIKQSLGKPQGAATIFGRRIILGEKIEIWGSGNTIRDYIDVDDVAEGLQAIMSIDKKLCSKFPVFNIGSGVGLSLNNLIKCLETAVGLKANVVFSEQRTFDIPSNILNIDKINSISKWAPRNAGKRLEAMMVNLEKELNNSA